MRMRPFPLLTLLLLLPSTAGLAQGRIELNQTTIDAAGGFPYTIDAPGSYVLTGDLDVPADTDGLFFAADGIVLDLNGFAIRGSFACGAGACGGGSGRGIATAAGRGADEATVRGGTVRWRTRPSS